MSDLKLLNQFIAYPVINSKRDPPRIVPASSRRQWMDGHDHGNPNRCLPLTMANQNGWFLLNPAAFTVRWTGEAERSGVVVTYDSDEASESGSQHARSWFRSGIVTWDVDYIFRTPPGFNLMVRGPANWPKPGIQALEGLVESDWIETTFTMNWKITIPNLDIRFEKDEPFCMITPIRRGDLEGFAPVVRKLSEGTRLHESFRYFRARRTLERLAEQRAAEKNISYSNYELDYMHGKSSDGKTVFPDHQTRLHVQPFVEESEMDTEQPDSTSS